MRSLFIVGLSLLLTFPLFSQQTVGVFLADSSVQSGYTLFTPGTDSSTYLIDNCGRVINTWTSSYKPGNAAYLLEDGSMIRAGKGDQSNFGGAGGGGGQIERFNWEGDLIWTYSYVDSLHLQHHEFEVMPNGNLLLLAWEIKSQAEAIAAGRHPNIAADMLWPEHVVEVQPTATGGDIVWEWHLWDHMIQDHDPTKSNYGVVADHPELLDMNANPRPLRDFIHANNVAYNPELDQIVLCTQELSELWVIDHSTTTAEAASHAGGNSGKGGDILYRWGNPAVYGRGTVADQQLFRPHNIHWIPAGLPDAGKLIIYNNGLDRPAGAYSSVDVIDAPVNAQGEYTLDAGQEFGPAVPFWSYTSDPPSDFYSSHMASAQRLPNGNTLICEANTGTFFEVELDGTMVWKYISPITPVGPIEQGVNPWGNAIFKCEKYTRDYAAFAGITLTAGDAIEINAFPITTDCESFTIIPPDNVFQVFPNPIEDQFEVEWPDSGTIHCEIMDMAGRKLESLDLNDGAAVIDCADWPVGIYILRFDQGEVLKLWKRRP